MKKLASKIRLSRETLQTLDRPFLRLAQGAGTFLSLCDTCGCTAGCPVSWDCPPTFTCGASCQPETIE